LKNKKMKNMILLIRAIILAQVILELYSDFYSKI